MHRTQGKFDKIEVRLIYAYWPRPIQKKLLSVPTKMCEERLSQLRIGRVRTRSMQFVICRKNYINQSPLSKLLLTYYSKRLCQVCEQVHKVSGAQKSGTL